MSEKTKKVWRKVQNILIDGAVLWVYWNIFMTTIFGFSKITILQAIILFFTIDFFATDYFCNIKSDFVELSKNKNEKMVYVASVLLVIITEIIWIVITVLLTMYSWNNILLQLLNLKLVQINFLQAFIIVGLFSLLFAKES